MKRIRLINLILIMFCCCNMSVSYTHLDVYKRQMRNSTLEKFKPIDPGLPSSVGTRSHELALFVVLAAPFAILCDSPDEYRKYPDILKYLAEVPTSWDQTIPLACLLYTSLLSVMYFVW